MARKAKSNPKAKGGDNATAAASAGGSKPKRVRRKCSAPGCDNRVVQGGVCVTHGAKRKLCSHPNCNKAVKLAGFCSTHGPARKKCDQAGCSRVAVQGGMCLSHGARRRVCDYPGGGKGGGTCCNKNAIMGGMCKKHYDRMQDANSMLGLGMCVPVATTSSCSGESGVESEGDQSSLGSSPSWPSSVATPGAGLGLGGVVRAVAAARQPHPAPRAPSPKKKAATSTSHRRSHKKARHHGHKRGLSIFDEMNTVDAIINSQQPQVQQSASYTEPQIQQSASYTEPLQEAPPRRESMSTKTPNTQVSFADCTSLSSHKGSTEKPPNCLGDSSCTCDACRSPTLAIFEQMIQASQKIDKGEIESTKYAGLSPLKMSPRKAPKESGWAKATETPKNVSFLPEEPTSTGSVVRKVSSNNMLGESGEQKQGAASPHISLTPLDYKPQYADEQPGAEGPASHALASLALQQPRDDANVSRTVSHDVEDRHHLHHGPGYYHHQYSQGRHPPAEYPYAPNGHHHAPHGHHAPPPYYNHYAQHPHYPPHYPPPHNPSHSTAPPRHYEPPQTPTLYDNNAQALTPVVSTHSTHQESSSLLPKPRMNTKMNHLFIPKEV